MNSSMLGPGLTLPSFKNTTPPFHPIMRNQSDQQMRSTTDTQHAFPSSKNFQPMMRGLGNLMGFQNKQ